MIVGPAMIAAASLAAGSLLTGMALADELSDVALAYLKRHGVPCLSVTQVDRPVRDYDMVATCHDGRRWALFLVEGEVAFVQPDSGEPYKWRREVYLSYPHLYGSVPRATLD